MRVSPGSDFLAIPLSALLRAPVAHSSSGSTGRSWWRCAATSPRRTSSSWLMTPKWNSIMSATSERLTGRSRHHAVRESSTARHAGTVSGSRRSAECSSALTSKWVLCLSSPHMPRPYGRGLAVLCGPSTGPKFLGLILNRAAFPAPLRGDHPALRAGHRNCPLPAFGAPPWWCPVRVGRPYWSARGER